MVYTENKGDKLNYILSKILAFLLSGSDLHNTHLLDVFNWS